MLRIGSDLFAETDKDRDRRSRAIAAREARAKRLWAFDGTCTSASFDLRSGSGSIRLTQGAGQQFKASSYSRVRRACE